MSEPTGRLAYGQAGTYDAIDDRAVIAAVTGYRTGLVGTLQAAAGAGLAINVRGGWLAIANCGDNTSAVVGSPTDVSVDANPGPPTGTREDVIWIDVDPDEGTWRMVVIPASTTAGRPGLAIAGITVPANATLASQMTIRPGESTLGRRLLSYHSSQPTGTSNAQTFESAQPLVWTSELLIRPGNWYRIYFSLASPEGHSGGSAGPGGTYRMGIGWHAGGAPSNTARLVRSTTISFPAYFRASAMDCEYVFRHPPADAAVARVYQGRMWSVSAGVFRPQTATGHGDGCFLYAEDLGS